MKISIHSMTGIYVGSITGTLLSMVIFSGSNAIPVFIGMAIGNTSLYCMSVIVSILEQKYGK